MLTQPSAQTVEEMPVELLSVTVMPHNFQSESLNIRFCLVFFSSQAPLLWLGYPERIVMGQERRERVHAERDFRDQSVPILESETITHFVNRTTAFDLCHSYQEVHFVPSYFFLSALSAALQRRAVFYASA